MMRFNSKVFSGLLVLLSALLFSSACSSSEDDPSGGNGGDGERYNHALIEYEGEAVTANASMMPTLQFFFDDFYSGNMGVGWATPQGDFGVTSMELEIHKGKTGEIGVGEYQAYLNRDAPEGDGAFAIMRIHGKVHPNLPKDLYTQSGTVTVRTFEAVDKKIQHLVYDYDIVFSDVNEELADGEGERYAVRGRVQYKAP